MAFAQIGITGWHESRAVAVGTPEIIEMPQTRPFSAQSFVLRPGGGGNLTIEYCYDDIDTVRNGSPVWIASSLGAVTSNTEDGFSRPVTAIRVTAATANGNVEVLA